MLIQEPTYLTDIIEFILRRRVIDKPVKTVEELVGEYGQDFKTYYPDYAFWYDKYKNIEQNLKDPERLISSRLELETLLKNIHQVDHRDILTPIIAELDKLQEDDISKFISRNMSVESYNMNGTIYNYPGSFGSIFDALKVTESCRLIVYHDNVRGGVLSKVSNLFDDMSYDQAAEYRRKDRLTKIHRLIVMPFWKTEGGTMAFGYITEKIVPGQRFPNIEFRFEDLKGVQGENIRTEFMRSIHQPTSLLATEFAKMKFNITDLEMRLRGISPIFLKAIGTKLSLPGSPFSKIIHAEGELQAAEKLVQASQIISTSPAA
jgi:hypothetical protein